MAVPVRKLARDRRGIAALEFAMVVPVLLLLLVGFLDVAYLARGYLRAQTTATQVGQIISQCITVSDADNAVIFAFAGRTLAPFGKPDPDRNWAVVVTAIGRSATGQPERWWAIDNRGANSGFATDGISLPANFSLAAGEAMFRTEVFVKLDSMLFSKANNLLVRMIGAQVNSITTVTSSLLHTSRAPDTSRLKTKSSTTGACLS